MYRRLIFVLALCHRWSRVYRVSYCFWVVIASIKSQPKTTGHQLLVAARDLGIGEAIREQDVKQIVWNGEPPSNAIVRVDAVVGRGAVAPIYAGEPILEGVG